MQSQLCIDSAAELTAYRARDQKGLEACCAALEGCRDHAAEGCEDHYATVWDHCDLIRVEAAERLTRTSSAPDRVLRD